MSAAVAYAVGLPSGWDEELNTIRLNPAARGRAQTADPFNTASELPMVFRHPRCVCVLLLWPRGPSADAAVPQPLGGAPLDQPSGEVGAGGALQ